MIKSHRTWLAVPPEEKDEARQAHPRLDNGQNAIVWDKEHTLWFARPGVELDKLERWLPRPHNMSMNADDPVTEFAQTLEDAGLVLKGPPVMDGSWQRVPTKNDKKGSKSGAYKGFLDGRPAGSYRDYRSADEKPVTWVYSGGADMDPRARLHLRAQAQQNREDSARELAQQYNRQANYAVQSVSRLPQATSAPYLTRKGVQAAPGVRINPKGELVIPFSNGQGKIRSYQRIPETGGKDARILKDSEKTGNWFTLGTPVNGQPVLFAEGYATAASLHEATGLPVLMTIDAGNMITVAQIARTLWPDSPFIFCADNDHHLKNPQTGEPENKGILSAEKAAALTEGMTLVPAFTLAELDQKLTDFNDLDVSRGREAFREIVSESLQSAGITTLLKPAQPSPEGAHIPSQQVNHMDNQEHPIRQETRPNPTSAQELEATRDLSLYNNKEIDAAALLQKANADPDYKTGLLSALGQTAGDMQFNGQRVDPAEFAASSLRGIESEARANVELEATRDLSRYNNKEIDAAALLQKANADPDYKAGLLSALGQTAGDMQFNGQRVDPAEFAASSLRGIESEARANVELEATRDLSRYNNKEIDAAALLQKANADPDYKAGLLSALGQTAGDMQFNGQRVDPAEFAASSLRGIESEARANVELEATRDLSLYNNKEIDAATLLQKASADPDYKAGLLSALGQTAGDMQFNGQSVDPAEFAASILRGIESEARNDAEYARRENAPVPPAPAEVQEAMPVPATAPTSAQELEATRDLSLYNNKEIDAAALLQKASADPDYKAGLLSALGQTAGDMQFNGQSVDPAEFAASILRGIESEARNDAEYARRENAPVPPAPAEVQEAMPVPATAPTSAQELEATRDLSLYNNKEIDAAALLQKASADPDYKSGLLSALGQTAGDMQFNGQSVDPAEFAASILRGIESEARNDAEYARRENAPVPPAPAEVQEAMPVPATAPISAQELEATRDLSLYNNKEIDAAALLQKASADPDYKAGLLSALGQTAGDMQFNGQSVDPAEFAASILRGIESEARNDAEYARRENAPVPPAPAEVQEAMPVPATAPTSAQELEATRDLSLYNNKEIDAAALLQKASADPDYKAGLLSALGQTAGDMQFNGQSVDPAEFAASILRGIESEARNDAEYARRENAPVPPAPAEVQEAMPVPATAPTSAQELEATRDLSLYNNKEIDAAALLQKASADPDYKSGLLSALGQTAGDMQFNGQSVDPAEFAASILRGIESEARNDAEYARRENAPVPPAPAEVQEAMPVPATAPISAQELEATVPQPLMEQATSQQSPPEPSTGQKKAIDEEMTSPAPGSSTSTQKEANAGASDASLEEPDGIVYGPRRPDAPTKEDLEKIITGLSWEMLKNKTQIFRLDGEDAFRDLGNRLEMCSGASQDDRKVLAALLTAAKFYGGVVELTGSPEFKENAMRLIITHDLEIRMKLPEQRTQLEEMRKQMGTSQDAVVTHMPTPDLNRQTPTGEQSTAPQTAATPGQPTPASPGEVTTGPQPHVPGEPVIASPPPVESTSAPEQKDAQATESSSPKNTDAIKLQEVQEEPAPSVLSPGESVTAVLKNAGEATYENKEQRGNSFFIELENRSGSHTYWGKDLRQLAEHHKIGDVVTLTLNGRDSWMVPGEEKERVKNNWSLEGATTGIAVSHARPEQGQQLMSFPIDTFGKLTTQICKAWPDYMTDLKLPSRFEERQFYLGEDRQPVMSPQSAAGLTPPGQAAPDRIIPVMASMDNQSNQMNLLLVQSAGEHLQGMVRLNGTLYPALATPTADSSQLVINAITDQGPRFAGYGQAVNFEPDGTTRAAPQLMTFHLKGREEEQPLPARLYTPEKQDDALFQRLGFEQTWKEWDDARKPEGRQEKTLHQEHSHSPGR